jgi:hypothetical protein
VTIDGIERRVTLLGDSARSNTAPRPARPWSAGMIA